MRSQSIDRSCRFFGLISCLSGRIRLFWLCLIVLFAHKVHVISSLHPKEFLLDIDGSSVIAGSSHVCAIEYRQGIDVGGRVVCFEDHDDVGPPKDVRFLFFD